MKNLGNLYHFDQSKRKSKATEDNLGRPLLEWKKNLNATPKNSSSSENEWENLIAEVIEDKKSKIPKILDRIEEIDSYNFENPNLILWERWEFLFEEMFQKIIEDWLDMLTNSNCKYSEYTLRMQFDKIKNHFLNFFKNIYLMTEAWKKIISGNFILKKEKNKVITWNWTYNFLLESWYETDFDLPFDNDIGCEMVEDLEVEEENLSPQQKRQNQLLDLYLNHPIWNTLCSDIIQFEWNFIFESLLRDRNIYNLIYKSTIFKDELYFSNNTAK